MLNIECRQGSIVLFLCEAFFGERLPEHIEVLVVSQFCGVEVSRAIVVERLGCRRVRVGSFVTLSFCAPYCFIFQLFLSLFQLCNLAINSLQVFGVADFDGESFCFQGIYFVFNLVKHSSNGSKTMVRVVNIGHCILFEVLSENF